MAFSLYSLIEAALLCINAIAILNERFLSKFTAGTQTNYPDTAGYGYDHQNSAGAKQQFLTLIRSVRTVMRVPLVAFNLVAVVFLILFG